MKQLKIALTALAAESGISQENWKTVPLEGADLTDVSAVVMTSRDEVPHPMTPFMLFPFPFSFLTPAPRQEGICPPYRAPSFR